MFKNLIKVLQIQDYTLINKNLAMFDNLFKSKKNEFNDSESKSEIINIIALLIEASQIDGTIDEKETYEYDSDGQLRFV